MKKQNYNVSKLKKLRPKHPRLYIIPPETTLVDKNMIEINSIYNLIGFIFTLIGSIFAGITYPYTWDNALIVLIGWIFLLIGVFIFIFSHYNLKVVIKKKRIELSEYIEELR